MIYEPRSSHPLRDPQHPQAQRKPGTTLPVATSASSSTGRSIAGRLLAAMGAGWDRVCRVEDRKGHDLRYSVDITRISEELGYAPQVPFEQGLADTVDWYRMNETWWRPLKGTVSAK